MGKIVAIGGGRYDDGEIINIFEYIVSLAEKKNPKVLFIPTAGHDDINGDEHIKLGFEKFGCEFDVIFLTDEKRTVTDIRSVIMSAGTTIEHQRPLQERVLDKGATDEGGQWHHGLLVQTDGLGLAGEDSQEHIGDFASARKFRLVMLFAS